MRRRRREERGERREERGEHGRSQRRLGGTRAVVVRIFFWRVPQTSP
jgi:hypothetical protein